MIEPSRTKGDSPNIVEHGGALDQARARFGEPQEGWLDLSTGISPWPYPIGDLGPDVWHRLPGRDAVAAMCAAAASYYGVSDPSHLVPAPGSQALIQMVPRLLAPCPVGVVGFTYAEHAVAWASCGHRVITIDPDGLDAAVKADTVRVIVLVNPNNPDGRVIAADRLLWLAERLGQRGGILVVDEAFADQEPSSSVASAAGRPGLLILRSFGKFFGLAGLRLGFALGPNNLIAALERAFGPWSVSGPAIEIARRAFADGAWQEAARERMAVAADRLDAVLKASSLMPLGGTRLYRLASHHDAAAIYEACGRAGILLRRFNAQPSWLRVGLAQDASGLKRLEQALGSAPVFLCSAQ